MLDPKLDAVTVDEGATYAYDILDVQTYIHNGKKKKKVKKKKRRVGGTEFMSSRVSHDSNLLLKTPNISQPQTL